MLINAEINATYNNESLLPRIRTSVRVRLNPEMEATLAAVIVEAMKQGNSLHVNNDNKHPLDKSSSGDLEIMIDGGEVTYLKNNINKYFAWTWRKLLVLGKLGTLSAMKGLLLTLCSTFFVRRLSQTLRKKS